jgi:hypothetical protein
MEVLKLKAGKAHRQVIFLLEKFINNSCGRVRHVTNRQDSARKSWWVQYPTRNWARNRFQSATGNLPFKKGKLPIAETISPNS